MANTGVARGKIYLARNKRLPIPLGWAINAAGEPTTDPQEAIDGIILPMAEHKGYAIAAMVDVLSGVLTGSGFLSAVHSPYKTAEKSNCGHLMIAIEHRGVPAAGASSTRAWSSSSREIKAVPLAKGFDEVFYPGEIEAEQRRAQPQGRHPVPGRHPRRPAAHREGNRAAKRSCRLPERCRYT